MNNISKYILFIIIFLILLSIYLDEHQHQDIIRSKLEAKGLPTPAFANITELKNILNNY